VLGERLEVCSLKPVTGFFRDGCCDTSRVGSHTVCAVMTARALAFSKSRGNATTHIYDLVTHHLKTRCLLSGETSTCRQPGITHFLTFCIVLCSSRSLSGDFYEDQSSDVRYRRMCLNGVRIHAGGIRADQLVKERLDFVKNANLPMLFDAWQALQR
jgi:hypothetical protein